MRVSQEGIILEIQRMSTEDGPGIRTTVFFKGCTLKCLWCHNPESISPKPQVHWIGSRCIGCLTCIESCPNHVLKGGKDGIEIDRGRCEGCGVCARECPSTAMELLGHRWTVEKLLSEVEKDKVYFEKSNGGITVSGGDPTVQADFVARFLAGCRRAGMHTALDTCGLCSEKALDTVLPHSDMVLFDLKLMDPDLHRAMTGSTNEKILANCLRVRDAVLAPGGPGEMWIRTPVIPDHTDSEENVRAIGAFIAEHLKGAVRRWELCAFNNLCRDKYKRLGADWILKDYGPLGKQVMERLAEVARKSGVDPGIVSWSGPTKVEEERQGSESPLRLVRNECGC